MSGADRGTDDGPAPAGPIPDALLRHLEHHQQQAQAEVDRLHAAIAEPTQLLDQAQRHLERLQTTHDTLLEIATPDPGEAPSPIDTLPVAYQHILAEFADTDGGLRAKEPVPSPEHR
ncbi:hypothetical protein [Spongiactinospora sp. 9N601]|uniref:hypothetical protein n=1 Tax=Spongiactinospora sp. 9N601 TaxID=3375149 RepID=UPI0037A76E2C